MVERAIETIQDVQPSRKANRHLGRKPLLLKVVGGVYSEDAATSTFFGQLQALHFHVHAFPPQGTAPFLVHSFLATGDDFVRNRALTAN